MTRTQRLRVHVGWHWSRFTEWVLRWIYAQHNARVLVDMEWRLIRVLGEATGNMMSKAYYDADTMLAEIARHQESLWQDGYAEGRRDLAKEAEIVDPNPPAAEI